MQFTTFIFLVLGLTFGALLFLLFAYKKYRTATKKADTARDENNEIAYGDEPKKTEAYKKYSDAREEYDKTKDYKDFFTFIFCCLLIVSAIAIIGKLGGDASYRSSKEACQRYAAATGTEDNPTVYKMDRQDTWTYNCYILVDNVWTDRDDIITDTNN